MNKTTKKLYSMIDGNTFISNTLNSTGMAYRLEKVRNCDTWIVQIGKFNSLTDPYIQGEISPQFVQSIPSQFKEILSDAVKGELVNYKRL